MHQIALGKAHIHPAQPVVAGSTVTLSTFSRHASSSTALAISLSGTSSWIRIPSPLPVILMADMMGGNVARKVVLSGIRCHHPIYHNVAFLHQHSQP